MYSQVQTIIFNIVLITEENYCFAMEDFFHPVNEMIETKGLNISYSILINKLWNDNMFTF